MLPPGRAKLEARPVSTGPPAVANTIGITDVACLAARVGGGVVGENYADISLGKFGCNLSEAFRVSLGPAIFDDDVATLRPTKLSKSLHKSSGHTAL